MLWQPLASFSKVKAGRFITCTFWFCAGVSGVAACAVSDEDLGVNPNAGPSPGAVIAPPSGPAGVTRPDDANLGRQFLDDSDASSFEYEVPRRGTASGEAPSPEDEFRARATDSELIGSEGGMGSPLDRELGSLERELDLEPTRPPGPAPSFSLTVKKIKNLFRKRKYQDALIETNYALEFYPQSPQLLMMKGTLHQKLQQIDLALSAYQEAFDLRPSRKLRAQIKYLRLKVKERESLRGPIEGEVIPEGVESIESVGPGFDIPADEGEGDPLLEAN